MEKFISPKDLIAANGGMLSISLSAVYAAIKRGVIPSIKIGRRILISQNDFIKWIEGEKAT